MDRPCMAMCLCLDQTFVPWTGSAWPHILLKLTNLRFLHKLIYLCIALVRSPAPPCPQAHSLSQDAHKKCSALLKLTIPVLVLITYLCTAPVSLSSARMRTSSSTKKGTIAAAACSACSSSWLRR
eukprot:201634-Pelagomonas_calceolata.AAC.1